MRTLSNDLASYGIRINNIIPGRIDTERVKSLDRQSAKQKMLSEVDVIASQQKSIPLGRYGTIEEFGAAAAFLLSEKASYITGTSLVVDGGKMKSIS